MYVVLDIHLHVCVCVCVSCVVAAEKDQLFGAAQTIQSAFRHYKVRYLIVGEAIVLCMHTTHTEAYMCHQTCISRGVEWYKFQLCSTFQ